MSGYREEWASIIEQVARDGLPGPRDLDVALDALEDCIGLSAEQFDGLANQTLAIVPSDLVDAVRDVRIALSLTSVPLKLRFADSQGLAGLDAVHEWMRNAHTRLNAALAAMEGE